MTVVWIFLISLILLILIRVPFAFATGLAVVVGFLAAGLHLSSLPTTLRIVLDSFTLLAIPCFIFAGVLMANGGVSAALANLLKAFVGRFRGYLGTCVVLTCMAFGSITGSSMATVSAVGGILVPEMEKEGYDKYYTTALLATSGFLGVMIPPSVAGITYSMMAEQNVAKVWMSTVGPAIILGFFFIIINYLLYGRKIAKNSEPLSLKVFVTGVWGAVPKAIVAIIMPVVIFGGIYGGVFTATEAGAVAVLYGLIAGWILYPFLFKQLSPNLLGVIKKSTSQAVGIGLILAFAGGTSHLISLTRIPDIIVEAVLNVTDSRILFLIMVNIILLLFGMIMECNTSIILLTPILLPAAQAYGINPIHFGAIMLMNLEIGMITPPHAANLFVACKITNTTIDKIIKPLVPFYVVCVIGLILVSYIPEISLFFPNLVK